MGARCASPGQNSADQDETQGCHNNQRMALVRNRLVGLCLMSAPLIRRLPLLPILHRLPLQGLLKSGRLEVFNWLHLWYLSSTRLQQAVKTWLRRKRKTAFWKGMRLLQRLARGQLCRLKVRAIIQDVILFLDFDSEQSDRKFLVRCVCPGPLSAWSAAAVSVSLALSVK
eukprot:gene5870-11857_t